MPLDLSTCPLLKLQTWDAETVMVAADWALARGHDKAENWLWWAGVSVRRGETIHRDVPLIVLDQWARCSARVHIGVEVFVRSAQRQHYEYGRPTFPADIGDVQAPTFVRSCLTYNVDPEEAEYPDTFTRGYIASALSDVNSPSRTSYFSLPRDTIEHEAYLTMIDDCKSFRHDGTPGYPAEAERLTGIADRFGDHFYRARNLELEVSRKAGLFETYAAGIDRAAPTILDVIAIADSLRHEAHAFGPFKLAYADGLIFRA